MKYKTIAVLAILLFTVFLVWCIRENAPPIWQVIILIGAWVSVASVMVFDAGEIDKNRGLDDG